MTSNLFLEKWNGVPRNNPFILNSIPLSRIHQKSNHGSERGKRPKRQGRSPKLLFNKQGRLHHGQSKSTGWKETLLAYLDYFSVHFSSFR